MPDAAAGAGAGAGAGAALPAGMGAAAAAAAAAVAAEAEGEVEGEAGLDPLEGVTWKREVAALRAGAPRLFAAAGIASPAPLPDLPFQRVPVTRAPHERAMGCLAPPRQLRVLLADFSAAQQMPAPKPRAAAATTARAAASGAAFRGMSRSAASGAGVARDATAALAMGVATGSTDEAPVDDDRFAYVVQMQRSDRPVIAPEWDRARGYDYSVAVGNRLVLEDVSACVFAP